MEKEIHGPLNEFQYGVTSHSMMVGGGSGTYRTVRWEKDGRVTLTEEQNGSGVAKTKVYEIDPEAAQKIRDFVEEENVAALSKVEVPSLYRPLDSCTTSSLRMEFDDREVGGLPYVVRNVFCGLAGGFFQAAGGARRGASESLPADRDAGPGIDRAVRTHARRDDARRDDA